MNDESSSCDEKSSTTGKLESLSKDELIRLFKSQYAQKKKFESRVNELTESNSKFVQVEKELRQEIAEISSKYSSLLSEANREKLNADRKSSEILSRSMEEKISNLENELAEIRSREKVQSELISQFVKTTVELCQLEMSTSEKFDEKFLRSFQAELELKQETTKQSSEVEKNHFQQRIEDLEFFNEEMKLEIDDLRSKIFHFQEEKKEMEREIDNYRRQVEDFEEQFLDVQNQSQNRCLMFDKSQSTSSLVSMDDRTEPMAKSCSTSSLINDSDVASLLHSVGIKSSAEDFIVPLNYESLIRLCTLLLERCQVLQQVLLKKNEDSENSFGEENFHGESIFLEKNEDFQMFQIHFRPNEHLGLDKFFQQLDEWTDHNSSRPFCRVSLKKPFDQYRSVSLRLELNEMKFVPEQVETDLKLSEARIDQLLDENQRQNEQIEKLNEKIRSILTFDLLKQRQTQLEEQLAEQCEKTTQLENIFQSETIDRLGLNQIEQIQCSYQQVLEKCRVAENLEKQIRIFEENLIFKENLLREKDELIRKVIEECKEEKRQRAEDEETLRQIHLNFEKTKEEMLNNFQKEIFRINEELQRQKSLVRSLAENKQSETRRENVDATIENEQNSSSRPETNSTSRPDRSIDADQILLDLQQTQQENEKLQRTIEELNQRLKNVPEESKENVQELKEKYHKMKVLLTRLKKDLQDKTQQPKQNLIDLEFADYEKTTKFLKDDLINKQKEIEDLRDELSNSSEKISCLQREIDSLDKEKAQFSQRAENLKKSLDSTKEQLKHFQQLENQHSNADDQIRSTIEKLRIDIENSKTLIHQLVNEKQQLIEKLAEQHENHQKTTRILEQNLRISTHELEISKKDYELLRDEFNNYKVRAQSVLKQQQSVNRERMPSVVDRQTEMEETIEKLKTTLREANNKMQLIITENEVLQKEQDRLIELQAKLTQDARKKEQELRKQFKTEIDNIENLYQQRLNESQDSIRNLTIQYEAQSLAFKEQMTLIQSENEKAVSVLNNQLELSSQEVQQFKILIDSLRQDIKDTGRLDSSSMGISQDDSRDVTPAWSSSQRHSFEESDLNQIQSTTTSLSTMSSENLFLDRQNSDRARPSTTVIEKQQSNSPDENILERQRLEDELNRTRSRLLSTVDLLDESELNNERLNQQIILLKDEIRRIERNVERAETISNLEYLKNVIVKFFTLKSSPERLQLIPVLVTMLKLSSDEQTQLVRVANSTNLVQDASIDEESNNTQPTSNSLSWSSYLNIW